MPSLSRDNVDVWKQNFRRKYSGNVSGLKILADAIATEAGELVTVTSANLEGGGGAGTITGNKLEMLQAAEELITELDRSSPNATAPIRSRVIIPDFSLSEP